jgi:cytidylate kinase
MDGRDIGTSVFPNAELKIFMTASVEVRAQRRFKEIQDAGGKESFDDVLKNLKERDHLDQTREVSPLRKADDAIELDNSYMTIPEQKAWLKAQFDRVFNS